jgi:hypothetical protein
VTASDDRQDGPDAVRTGPKSGAGDLADHHQPISVLDMFVFAPLGLLIRAGEMLPEAIETGRREYEKRAATAQLMGKLIVSQQQRRRRLAKAAKAVKPEPSYSPGPSQASQPPSPSASTAAASSAAARFGRTQAQPPLAPDQPLSPPDRPHGTGAAELPIDGYDTLPARSLLGLFESLTPAQLSAALAYEAAHRRRETVLNRLNQLLIQSAADATTATATGKITG